MMSKFKKAISPILTFGIMSLALVVVYVLGGTPQNSQAQINRNMALDVINVGFTTGVANVSQGNATTIVSVTSGVSGIIKGASTVDFAFAQVITSTTVYVTHAVISATGQLDIVFNAADGANDVSVALQVWR